MYKREAKELEFQTKRLEEITRQKYQLREMKTEGFFPDEKDYQKKKEELLLQEQLVKQEIVHTDDSAWDALFEDVLSFTTKIKDLYNSDDPLIKRAVVSIIGLNFSLKDKKLKIEAKNAFIALHRIKKDLWDKNLWIEPKIRPSEQSKQGYYDYPIFYGAEDGIQIEPLLDINRINYTLFFGNREETELLQFQLRQLNEYLSINVMGGLG